MSARQGKTTSPASSTLYAPSKWLTGPFPFWVVVKFSQVGFGWVERCARKGVLCARDGPPRSRREGQECLAAPSPPETPRIVQGENLGHPSVPSCADQKFTPLSYKNSAPGCPRALDFSSL